MFLFRRKVLAPEPEPTMAVGLSEGAFYLNDKPVTPAHQIACVFPCDGDNAPHFSEFIRLCAERLLAEYPFVVEQMYDSADKLRREPFIKDFLDGGGKVVLAQKEYLLAISERHKSRLISLLPERSLNWYGCDIYAFREAVPVERLFDPTFDLKTSGFALHLVCSEWHDYIQMESAQDLTPFVDVIRSVCQEQGRELIIEYDE